MATKGCEIAFNQVDIPERKVVEIKAAAALAHRDTAYRDELFRQACSDTGRQSVEAAWALTHLPKSDIDFIGSHREELTETALKTENVSLRRLTLALLERLEWREEDVRTDLLDFCFEHLMSPKETYGVRALCAKIAYAQCRHYAELREELRQSLLFIDPATIGSGLKHCRNKILGLLK